MQRALVTLFRIIPLEVLYAVLVVVIPFYMVFSPGYLSSYHYFTRRQGFNPVKAFFKVYANYFVFGEIILDRFAMYAGRKFDIVCEGKKIHEELCAGESGFMMLSSHVGNYELAGYSLTATKKINALVFAGETETVMSNRNNMFDRNNIAMIPMREDMSHIFALNAALVAGEIVSMPGDRIFGSQKYLTAEFLGKEARFPLGPFNLAVQRDVPVVAVFVMKEGVRKYRAFVRLITSDPSLSKAERTQSLVDGFAKNLDEIVRRYPTQWFNFFEFWKDEN